MCVIVCVIKACLIDDWNLGFWIKGFVVIWFGLDGWFCAVGAWLIDFDGKYDCWCGSGIQRNNFESEGIFFYSNSKTQLDCSLAWYEMIWAEVCTVVNIWRASKWGDWVSFVFFQIFSFGGKISVIQQSRTKILYVVVTWWWSISYEKVLYLVKQVVQQWRSTIRTWSFL